MVSVVWHLPPEFKVRHDLFVSLSVIKFVLLIAEQSLYSSLCCIWMNMEYCDKE